MNARIPVLATSLAAVGALGLYQFGGSGSVFGGLTGSVGVAQPATEPSAAAPPDEFRQIRRPGSVELEGEYDVEQLTIPRGEIHTLLPRDAIPALTDPKRQAIADADWLDEDARIIVVRVKDEVLGVPLAVLDWHEIVNTTVGGEPVAATYCPLCDSATVFSRRVPLPAEDGEAPEHAVLEFGVSGSLYNSNVLMYDRRDRGLWSQLGMRAVSGPLSGTHLEMMPVELVTFTAFKETHPEAPLVSNETGHERNYGRSPYESYFKDGRLMVPVRGVGEALPHKTLGVGIAAGAQAWFVPAELCADGYTLETDAGPVTLSSTDAGVTVASAPAGVRTAQTFYYSWSAFYPATVVVTE